MLIRINKYLASLGIASRRKIDELIKFQKVKVNQKPISLGQKIDPIKDCITINSVPIHPKDSQKVYFILNKPVNVLTTTKDDRGRPTVLDYVKSTARLFPVGRLDFRSSGLVILTNDGRIGNILTHPKYHLPKTYLVNTDSKILPIHLKKLSSGLILNGQKLLKADVSIYKEAYNYTILKITLYQGIKRQIRLMFEQLKLNLISLHRISIGPINIGNLKAGHSRLLSPQEIKILESNLK